MESDKILREIRVEEAKLKQESEMVEAASDDEANEGEDAASNTMYHRLVRSLRLSDLSPILRVRTSKLIETVSSLRERVFLETMPPAAEYKIDIDGGESIDTFSAYVPISLPSCLVRALEERQREKRE